MMNSNGMAMNTRNKPCKSQLVSFSVIIVNIEP